MVKTREITKPFRTMRISNLRGETQGEEEITAIRTARGVGF